MASSPNVGQGLSLHEAARQIGVPFTQENQPTDKDIQVNGMNFHYLEWNGGTRPTLKFSCYTAIPSKPIAGTS